MTCHVARRVGEFEAIQGTTREGTSVVQFVPRDPDKVVRALERSGISYTTREVVIVRVLDEPGALGSIALVMSNAGINIDSVYVTTRGHAPSAGSSGEGRER